MHYNLFWGGFLEGRLYSNKWQVHVNDLWVMKITENNYLIQITVASKYGDCHLRTINPTRNHFDLSHRMFYQNNSHTFNTVTRVNDAPLTQYDEYNVSGYQI